ncbi:Retrovirus-related Pol polyprotein from transposon TNT 1-94 [Cucumis melo var. makuwa]|uniref:Retrovirus-related Pol polyprotein from transposon TNT 1-94 n=1 Tax=Cucumis melo var. makuwa TaxID=1194695 RepID=A0A5D3DHX8_CUCMM|nr:Retrovirus-related Pol polyprotein from transposon TNT 1-94 [Cucumis melo var. makuwa]
MLLMGNSTEALMVSHRNMWDAWIMDSKCTYHMTLNQDFLIDFQKNDEEKVLLGDNDICGVKGTDLIQIATHDGMIKKLTNVRDVPELKRNLISLGEIDRSSYTSKFENGALRVTKSSLVKLRGTLRKEATQQPESDGVQSQEVRTLIDEGAFCEESSSNNDLQNYQLTHDWVQRVKDSSTRYGYADLVAYTFTCATDGIEVEHLTFEEWLFDTWVSSHRKWFLVGFGSWFQRQQLARVQRD